MTPTEPLTQGPRDTVRGWMPVFLYHGVLLSPLLTFPNSNIWLYNEHARGFYSAPNVHMSSVNLRVETSPENVLTVTPVGFIRCGPGPVTIVDNRVNVTILHECKELVERLKVPISGESGFMGDVFARFDRNQDTVLTVTG